MEAWAKEHFSLTSNEFILGKIEDLDGKMLKVRTGNSRQLRFAISDIKDLFLEKETKGPQF